MLSSKGGKKKKISFSHGKTYFFEIQGVEVGSKNRSKIDVKNDAETNGLGNSILIDFCWIWEASWPSKTEPRRSKIDVEMASKFDQFLKASWNAIFSAQEAPRRASAADRRSGWSRPEAPGGGFRRGKTRDRLPEPLRQELGPRRWAWKDKKTWMFIFNTPSRVGRRIEAPLGGSTAAARF